jgi:hypothetical protein
MKACASLCCVLSLAVCALAQGPATGLPPFSSQASLGFETINVQNLNVHFSIPVISLGGRGLNFSFPLVYDSSIWVNSGTAWTPVVDKNGSPTWGWQKDWAVGSISYNSTAVTCRTTIDGYLVREPTTRYNNYVYTDAAGQHKFMLDFYADLTDCSNFNTFPRTGYATDGSGIYIDASSPDSPVVTNVSGTKVSFTGVPTDTNGNYFTKTVVGSNEVDWTDTLGNSNPPALKVVNSTNTATYTYTSPAGTPAADHIQLWHAYRANKLRLCWHYPIQPVRLAGRQHRFARRNLVRLHL